MSDDLSINVGGNTVSGWTGIRVTRGIERMPNDFEIEMTDYFPGSPTDIQIQPGASCQVMLGPDLVITGYVDVYEPRIDGESHAVSLSGRSKSEDVVDCAAEWPSAQIVNSSALQIAQKLCEPYGIIVTQNAGDQPIIPQFNLMYGETAVEIVERITRYSQLLYYDMPDGSILLTQASTKQAASGFQEGVNVQSASARLTMTRYSDYTCVYQAVASFSDGQSLNSGQNNSMNMFYNAVDQTVPRHRMKIIIVESGDFVDFKVTKQRAVWERNRRYGKGYEVTITTDGWRDSAGNLWEPNTLAPINLPSLKLVNKLWLISNVTYTLNEQGGNIAIITMNDPIAFQPEPIIIVPQPFAEGPQNPTTQ